MSDTLIVSTDTTISSKQTIDYVGDQGGVAVLLSVPDDDFLAGPSFFNHGSIMAYSAAADYELDAIHVDESADYKQGQILRNTGLVQATAPGAGAVGINLDGFDPRIENSATGQIIADGVGGFAIQAFDASAPIINDGLISADGTEAPSDSPVFMSAAGLFLRGGNVGAAFWHIHNSGTIEAHGEINGASVGVFNIGYMAIHNSGTITATVGSADETFATVGIAIEAEGFEGQGLELINSGLVAGSIAVQSEGHTHIVNHGTIEGNMTFGTIYGLSGEGHKIKDTIINDGLITGYDGKVAGVDMGAGNDLYDGSHGTLVNAAIEGGDGNDVLIGGAGNDVLYGNAGDDVTTGGLGSDTMIGYQGHDTFIYNGVRDSTGVVRDEIQYFDATLDTFDLPTAVTGVDAAVTHGKLSDTSFNIHLADDIGAGQLAANHAVLFTPDGGTLKGETFLIIDANGIAGYQANQDYVILLTLTQNTTALTASNFV